MKKLLIGLFVFGSYSAFAGVEICACQIYETTKDNTELILKTKILKQYDGFSNVMITPYEECVDLRGKFLVPKKDQDRVANCNLFYLRGEEIKLLKN